MVGVTNQPVIVFNSQPIPFQLGFLTGTHCFLLVPSVPIHLLGEISLESYHAPIDVSQEGEILLHLNLCSNKDSSLISENSLSLWVPISCLFHYVSSPRPSQSTSHPLGKIKYRCEPYPFCPSLARFKLTLKTNPSQIFNSTL